MKSFLFSIVAISILLVSCQPKTDSNGWTYNDPKQGGFQKVHFVDQETALGMILIEGQELVLPTLPADTTLTIIPSFYISKYQETNAQYCAYLDYIHRYYSHATYINALPDTTVWEHEQLSRGTKDYLRTNYLRNEIFHDYPVVGVNPEQVEKYASWKTDRMNELILVREGVLLFNTSKDDSSEVFTTEGYYNGAYEEGLIKNLHDLNPDGLDGKKLGTRIVRMEDGIFVPRYRLPEDQEWQFAALAIGNYKNKYVKTDKETKMKKSFPPAFKSLYVKPTKDMYDSQYRFLPFLKRVYEFEENNYRVYGLSSGLKEIVGDSLGSYIVGSDAINYAAFHFDNDPTQFNYFFPESFEKPIHLDLPMERATGFRLAMDRVDPIGEKKRR
ncbi:MAG: hypothetical protein ACI837_000484 [Crocinitomicaceae bacterium]|jgi:hypothetical protein